MAVKLKEDKTSQLSKSSRLYTSLGNYEISILAALWIFFYAYATLNFHWASRKSYRLLSEYDQLGPGWFGSNGFGYDKSDDEWDFLVKLFVYGLPWFILHLIGSQVLRCFDKALLAPFNITLSSIYVVWLVGIYPALSFYIQPIIMFGLCQIRSKYLVWAFALIAFHPENSKNLLGAIKKNLTGKDLEDGSFEAFFTPFTVVFAWHWINLRCVSYCMDVIDGVTKNPHPRYTKVQEFLEFLSYVLYLPMLVSGPVVLFRHFHKGFHSEPLPWTINRVKRLVLGISRFFFWIFVGHIWNHLFYHGSLKFHEPILERMDAWSLCGLGLAYGSFFHLKYVIFYGLPREFALEDGIVGAPHPPKCVARIHLYSDMWRSFDQGLHEYLKHYIYIPLVKMFPGTISKFLSSAVVFGYIYIWHGVMPSLFLWSLYNFLSVTLESVGKMVGRNTHYLNLENSILGPKGKRRLHALVSTPLFVCSVIAGYFFLLGTSATFLIFLRTFHPSVWTTVTPTVMFFAYCGAQFSIEAKNWEILSGGP